MVTSVRSDAMLDVDEYQEYEQFEKTMRTRARSMPSRRSLSAKRAMRRTPASRRASRRVASMVGGKDRRRHRHPQ